MQKRVLIIDDEPSVGTLIKINLKGKGFAVETAESGAEGIRRAEAERFDLVILDVALPGMNGIEVCRALRELESYGDTPIVMISSRSDSLTITSAREAGASDYLPKPFTFAELIGRIEDLLLRPFSFGDPPGI
jgi:two-component system, OmpR family, alkaline phosphatase synthesis response regulator PhoP